MNSIQSLVESANPWKSLQSDAARLAKKWSVTGLLEGIGDDTNRNNMSLLLENQAKQLVMEASATGANGGSFSPGQSENWAGIALPLVRKVFGQIASKEFVSVQPMNLPSGLVFFLDFQYGSTKNPFTSGESMYGNRNVNSTTPFSTTAASGGLYGAGRFTYSENQFSSSLFSTGSANGGLPPVVAANTALIVTASWSELAFDSALSASVAGNRIYKAIVSASTISTSADFDGVRGFIASGAGFLPSALLPQFTTYDNTFVNFFFTGSSTLTAAAASGGLAVFYNKTTADNNRGDFESGSAFAAPNAAGAGISIPEINIKMQSQAIVAKTRKLKAVWTPEFAQDLRLPEY